MTPRYQTVLAEMLVKRAAGLLSEEENYLDQLDELWWALSERERELVEQNLADNPMHYPLTHEIEGLLPAQNPQPEKSSARVLALDFATRRVVLQHEHELNPAYGFELVDDGRWQEFTVPQGWGTSPVRSAKDGGQTIGSPREGTGTIRLTGPGLAPLHTWMRTRGVSVNVWSSPATLRVVAAWLLGLKRSLMHGAEIHDLARTLRAPVFGAAEVDRLLLPLVKAGVCRPYCWDPRPGTFAEPEAPNGARELPKRLAEEGPLAATGCLFWYFTRTSGYEQLPNFSL